MPLLSGNTTETWGINLSGTGTVTWVLSAVSQLDQRFESVSTQGTATASGATILPNSINGVVHGPASRELQFFSAINLGTSSNVVTLGKAILGTSTTTSMAFFQFGPPTLLQANESFTYVKNEGFQTYDSNGLQKLTAINTATTQQATLSFGAAVALTSGVTATVVSLTLNPGTYRVWGQVDYSISAGTATNFQTGISNTTSFPAQTGNGVVGPDSSAIDFAAPPAGTTGKHDLQTQAVTVTLAAQTAINLLAFATFGGGTISAFGTISAVQTG